MLVLSLLMALPVVLIMWQRVNAAVVFMSLCLGAVLVQYVATDAIELITAMFRVSPLEVGQWIRIGLLVAPFLLTILFMRKTVAGNKQLTNFFPAVASGMLFALVLTPLLPKVVQVAIEKEDLWKTVSNLQTAVVVGGAFFTLLFLFITNHQHGGEEKHKK